MDNDCLNCPVKGNCHYPFRPCACVGQRKFWSAERRATYDKDIGYDEPPAAEPVEKVSLPAEATVIPENDLADTTLIIDPETYMQFQKTDIVEILKLCGNGEIYHLGRLITTDPELVAALKYVVAVIPVYCSSCGTPVTGENRE